MGRCILVLFVVVLAVFILHSSCKCTKSVSRKAASHRRKYFQIFETKNNTNETGQLGSTAELPCFVKYPTAALNVSWWKVNSSALLTTNNVTKSADRRFIGRLKDENTHHWVLRIRYTQTSDEGLYECRLEGDFVASIFVTLRLQKILQELMQSLRIVGQMIPVLLKSGLPFGSVVI
ncbi:uncharacterized protein LOC135144810 isoform X2 [Zophobas morio]|uniref:uncharacterized protein LOC135144810 isoform X2 n=1 Tax=Zophobas morio TaxID=2755281 RepID=UPI0030831203